jgi:hypothetical protein
LLWDKIRIIRRNTARIIQPNDAFASDSAPAQSAHKRWSYFALFGMQTVGAAALIWTGLFLYRQILADTTSHETQPWAIVGSLLAIALMQISYWVSHHLRPSLPQFKNILLGHGVLFLARMVFVLPTSIFGFVFIAQRPEFDIPVFKRLVLLLGLFSLFCYVGELERLGRVFIG